MKKALSLVLVVILTIVLCLTGCSGKEKKIVVNFLNWGEYMDPDVVNEFNAMQDEIEIVCKYTTSNEEMYALCSTEGSEIDIIVPSDYMVERMINEGLLAKMDYKGMENYENIKAYSESRTFDPNSEYSVPFMCGTLGIVYNTKLVDDEVKSWDILWDEKYSGKIMMYSSIRDTMAVALSRLGYDINSTNPEEIKEAGATLMEQRPLVLAYGTDDIKTSMVGGAVALAMDYSGGAAAAIMENPDLSYVVPEEGSNVWVDNLVILENSDVKEAAMTFINYLMDTEISARNVEYIGYSSPDPKAMELVSEELQSNPALYVTDDMVARCKYFVDLGDALSYYNDEWMKIFA